MSFLFTQTLYKLIVTVLAKPKAFLRVFQGCKECLGKTCKVSETSNNRTRNANLHMNPTENFVHFFIFWYLLKLLKISIFFNDSGV